MYIRKKIVHNKKTGNSYAYYQLLESRNTEKGPRNTVLLHIGRLDISNEEQKLLSTLIDHKIKGYSRSVRFSDKIEQLAEQIYMKYMHSLGKSHRELDKPVSETEVPESELSLGKDSQPEFCK